jgi:hypothetical protein
MSSITAEEAKRLALIRRRVSYKGWQELLDKVQRCRDAKEVMLLIYKELDDSRAFRFLWVAQASKESLDLVLQETP